MPKSVAGVMHEFKHGQLHSGSSTGPKVKNRKQAIAIALSEQRQGGAMHGRTGKITSIDEHHSRKHATITVRHGKQRRMKTGDGSTGPLAGFDQPESRIHVSKEDAKNYKLGQRVQAGLSPYSGTDDDGDEDGDQLEAPAPKAKPAKRGGKKMAGYGGGGSVIRAAMSRG